MNRTQMLTLIVALTSSTTLVFFLLFIYFYCKQTAKSEQKDVEKTEQKQEKVVEAEEEPVTFQDGEDLTVCDILDAPGKVIGKSNYGTLYKALLQSSNSVKLLRKGKKMDGGASQVRVREESCRSDKKINKKIFDAAVKFDSKGKSCYFMSCHIRFGFSVGKHCSCLFFIVIADLNILTSPLDMLLDVHYTYNF